MMVRILLQKRVKARMARCRQSRNSGLGFSFSSPTELRLYGMTAWSVAFHPEFAREYDEMAADVQDELAALLIYLVGRASGRPLSHVDTAGQRETCDATDENPQRSAG
ncbi:hypothetical protein [Mesorhizobium sp. L-8-3]|uniref:hypothetical protein n=1 Tax=Mesorhizobium sp. L-8-3 TaxID=2744522 RepID=UPI001927550C|nr:hypothetical protein [Mesorhizobium sp. L-8-3]BCH22577.1 hypothetical protein MesoLjLb_23620 [Mesorhizobium sp. L-8-3]